ncbi:MAG: YjbQ family protein [Firmicutes bacterium]|nr:YjbQ family protein [Bacillota bacterium]
MKRVTVKTKGRNDFADITSMVAQEVESSGIEQGSCIVFVPHTTCGITINENTDPNVAFDMQHILNGIVPWSGDYRHAEGNSAAHLKASLMGFSVQVLVNEGRLCLGTWQGIYLCEFDGPRTRQIWIQLFAG